MKPSDIYRANYRDVSKQLSGYIRCYLPLDTWEFDYELASPRVQIREHAFYHHDHCRFTEICSFWFDDEPVAIGMRAGRDGRDDERFVVTNWELYKAMLVHLVTLGKPWPEPDEEDLHGEDDDLKELDFLCGNSVAEYLER